MNFSIVMAYRGDKGIRARHLDWTVSNYRKLFPGAEIVISRDTGVGWDTFCKSRMINEGVAKARNNNLLITDIDVVFQKDIILEALEEVEKHSMIIPMNELWWLSRQGTERVLNSKRELKVSNDMVLKKEKRVLYRPNGWHVMTKDSFYEAGGYDERFVGWGGEDSCFIRACVTMSSKPFLRKEAVAYHLWHPVDNRRHKKRDRRSGVLIQKYIEAFGKKDRMTAILNKRGEARCGQ